MDGVGAAAAAQREDGHHRDRGDQRGGGKDPSGGVGRRQTRTSFAPVPKTGANLSLAAPNEAQSQNLRLQASRRPRRSAASTPSTRTTLSRAFAPRTTLTRDGATPARAAISRHSASLARPSTGGALTRTA